MDRAEVTSRPGRRRRSNQRPVTIPTILHSLLTGNYSIQLNLIQLNSHTHTHTHTHKKKRDNSSAATERNGTEPKTFETKKKKAKKNRQKN